MTGTNDNRPDFRQMIEDSKKHDFSIVLVYKFDRFSRNKYETTKHKKTLKDNGVKVVSATEYIPDEYYSAELSQKVKRGMNETRQKGNFTGGTIIYGYKVENHKVVIDEEKAEVVRFIYDQYAQGVYVKDIIVKSLREIPSTTYLKTKSIRVFTDTATKFLQICIRKSCRRKFTKT